MNERTIKALRLIGFGELVVATLLGWFAYHFYSTLERPTPGMRVTSEMYQAQFTFIMIIIELLPILAGAFFFFGVAILYYLREGRQQEK
jgi:hypothetical protein